MYVLHFGGQFEQAIFYLKYSSIFCLMLRRRTDREAGGGAGRQGGGLYTPGWTVDRLGRQTEGPGQDTDRIENERKEGRKDGKVDGLRHGFGLSWADRPLDSPDPGVGADRQDVLTPLFPHPTCCSPPPDLPPLYSPPPPPIVPTYPTTICFARLGMPFCFWNRQCPHMNWALDHMPA